MSLTRPHDLSAPVRLDDHDLDLDDLRRRVEGPVLVAGDERLDAEVAAWNLAVRHTPAVVVGATCAEDVRAAVEWAGAHRLRVAVQATGHGPVRDAAGSLLITTGRMQGLTIDPERRTARAEAGVRWRSVMSAAAEHRLAGLCGSSSDVGVVGYSLGGGMGPLGRKHGFAADRIQALDLVTADGVLHRVSADSEPELFWAVRGGKGNFGIVTALEFELVAVPTLIAGGLFFRADDAAAVLHRWREWAPTVPEEVSTSVAVMRLPPMEELPPPLRGQTVVHVRYAYCGDDPEEGQRLAEPVAGFAPVLLGGIGPMTTDQLDAVHMDPVDPLPFWEKGMLLRELESATVDALLSVAGPQHEIPLIMVEVRLLGGAFGRGPGNAVSGRDGAFSVMALGPMVPELVDVVPAVGRGVLGALAPWAADGCLVNFLGDVDGPDEVAGAWSPEVIARLRAVKRAVDPAGMFAFGHTF